MRVRGGTGRRWGDGRRGGGLGGGWKGQGWGGSGLRCDEGHVRGREGVQEEGKGGAEEGEAGDSHPL